jgi:hypothetical protein
VISQRYVRCSPRRRILSGRYPLPHITRHQAPGRSTRFANLPSDEYKMSPPGHCTTCTGNPTHPGERAFRPKNASKRIKSAAVHYSWRLPKRPTIGLRGRSAPRSIGKLVHLLFHDGDEWMYTSKWLFCFA